MLCTAHLISSDSPTFHAMLVMTQNAPVENCPEFNSPGRVSYKSPSGWTDVSIWASRTEVWSWKQPSWAWSPFYAIPLALDWHRMGASSSSCHPYSLHGGRGRGEKTATQDLPANHSRMQAVTRSWKGPEWSRKVWALEHDLWNLAHGTPPRPGPWGAE